MPLILLKTFKKHEITEILGKKGYCNMKKFFSTFLNVQKWVLYIVSEKENVYSVYFLVFNQNFEINSKLLKNDFSCKIKIFFVKQRVFL